MLPAVERPGLTCRTELDWVGTVAGRIGYAFNNVLLYAKGGVAFANEEYSFCPHRHRLLRDRPRPSGDDPDRLDGRRGRRIRLHPELVGKVEYNFMDFGADVLNLRIRRPRADLTAIDIDQQIHVVKAGINYRFNWGAPVVARY